VPESKIVAIIQARMSSSRLPGKVLLDLAGQPMLVRVVERTRRAKLINQVVVATTTDPSDDAIEALCVANGYAFSRGNLYDVLDRYYHAARQFQAGVIVRITADCPLIDSQVVDQTIQAFLEKKYPPTSEAQGLQKRVIGAHSVASIQSGYAFDFAANRLPAPYGRTYPIGLDTEVCSFEALGTAWKEADQPHQREHVMPYFYDHPERFRILLVDHPQDFGTHRWTVDTPQDMELLRQIYAHFPGRDDFSWLEVLALFERHPELAQINSDVQHKHYLHIDERGQNSDPSKDDPKAASSPASQPAIPSTSEVSPRQ
jgi:spore coat polysaccharide biosynthesis protein SpsF